MLQNLIITLLIFFFSGVFSLVFGQTVPVKPSIIAGDVLTVAENKLVVSSKTGQIEVTTTDKTVAKKVSAEAPNFATAAAASLTDIMVGDKVTVSGILSSDGKTLPARNVYFISKADIDAKHAREAAEWQRRGIMGKITSVKPETNQFTVETRTLMGTSSVTVTPKDGAAIKRYAPDSIRFDDATASSLGDMKPGDMVRALGDRSSDGLSFSAEQVISGAFQTVAGTVKSVDTEKNEIVIKNLQTGKDMTIVIGDSSVLKRFPAEQAEAMARMQMMQAGGARPMGGRPGGNPQGQPQAGQSGQPGMRPGGMRPNGGIDDILERSPVISAADLKAGETIALSSSKTDDVTRLKAIKLFAGVEPFLRAAQASSGGRGGRGGIEGSFNIPGLDDFGSP